MSAATHARMSGDPTKPARYLNANAQTQAVDSNIQLSAIFVKNDKFSAVINQQVLVEQDLVSGWRVIEITANAVILQSLSEPNSDPVRFLVSEEIDVKKQIIKE